MLASEYWYKKVRWYWSWYNPTSKFWFLCSAALTSSIEVSNDSFLYKDWSSNWSSFNFVKAKEFSRYVCHPSQGLNNFLLEETFSKTHHFHASVLQAKRSLFRQSHWKIQRPFLPYHFKFNLLTETHNFFVLTQFYWFLESGHGKNPSNTRFFHVWDLLFDSFLGEKHCKSGFF